MNELLRFARNDGLMHLSGRKHIIVLDHAIIHVTCFKNANARDIQREDALRALARA
jgi:hypothetical protein